MNIINSYSNMMDILGQRLKIKEEKKIKILANFLTVFGLFGFSTNHVFIKVSMN